MKTLTLNMLLLLCALLLTACTGGGGGGGGGEGQEGSTQNPQTHEEPKPVDETKVLEVVQKLEQVWRKVELKWINLNDFSKSVEFGRHSSELSKLVTDKMLESVFVEFQSAFDEGRNPEFEKLAREAVK